MSSVFEKVAGDALSKSLCLMTATDVDMADAGEEDRSVHLATPLLVKRIDDFLEQELPGLQSFHQPILRIEGVLYDAQNQGNPESNRKRAYLVSELD